VSNSKYELIDTEHTVNWLGKKLFRIRAKVESEKNLTEHGNARVHGNAQVSGDAQVSLLHQVSSITNLHWSLTSLPKGVQVGCHFHTMNEWKECHLEIGEANGLSKEMAKEYYRLMKAIRRIQRLEALERKKGT
jgi:GTP1/Obg family GTP-binding protein